MPVAAIMMRHMEWQWRVSLLIPTILVSIRPHTVDRILGDKDPITSPLEGSMVPAIQARAGSGTIFFTFEIFAQVQSLKQRLHLQINI